jgi:RHS repeat-associated protein
VGSFRLATTPARGYLSSLAYAPFGKEYSAVNQAPANGFTGIGSYFDFDEYDFPARQYSNQGRWVSPDPSGPAAFHLTDPQSLNRYAYARNTPLSVIDPTGLNLRNPFTNYGGGYCDSICQETGGGGGAGYGTGIETFGYDIFDAIGGAPGTYVSYNIYGQMSFGFSFDLYQTTQSYIDANNQSFDSLSKDGTLGTLAYLTNSGFHVTVQDLGADTIVTGLIPDLLAADYKSVENQSVANMPPSVRNTYESLIAGGASQSQALFTLFATGSLVAAMSADQPDLGGISFGEPPLVTWANQFLADVNNLYAPIILNYQGVIRH